MLSKRRATLTAAAATAPAFAAPTLDGTVISTMGDATTVSLHPSERGIGENGIVQATNGTEQELPASWILDPRDQGKVDGNTVTVSTFASRVDVQDFAKR